MAGAALPVPHRAGLLFNVVQQTDLRLACLFVCLFLISMPVQFPSRLFGRGWNGKKWT